jgi:hypothetical protein
MSLPALRTSLSPRPSLDRRAVRSASIAGLLSLVAWLGFATPALADDGAQLVQEFARADGLRLWNHVLYFPAARIVELFGVRPDRALWLLSALASAVLVGTTYASAFLVTGSRAAAAITCLLVAVTPAVAHHATFVEVHALHGGTVGAGVLALLLAQRSPRLVLAVAFVTAVLAVLTHRSAALLLPALTAVAAAALEPGGGWRACGRAALAAGTGIGAGYAIDAALHAAWPAQTMTSTANQIAAIARAAPARMLLDEVLWPLCGLPLGAAAAWRRTSGPAVMRWAPALALGAYAGAIVWMGIPTSGGYWFGAIPFLALGVALQLPALLATRAGRAVVVIALAAGAWLAIAAVTDAGRRAQGEVRLRRIAAAAALLPDGGTLLSTGVGMQVVDGAARGVREIDLTSHIGGRLLAGVPVDDVATAVVKLVVSEAAASPQALVWTAEWRHVGELPPPVAAALEHIEARVLAEFRSTPVATDLAPAFRLEPRGSSR